MKVKDNSPIHLQEWLIDTTWITCCYAVTIVTKQILRLHYLHYLSGFSFILGCNKNSLRPQLSAKVCFFSYITFGTLLNVQSSPSQTLSFLHSYILLKTVLNVRLHRQRLIGRSSYCLPSSGIGHPYVCHTSIISQRQRTLT